MNHHKHQETQASEKMAPESLTEVQMLELFAEELASSSDQAICCSASLSTVASWGCGTLSSGACVSCAG